MFVQDGKLISRKLKNVITLKSYFITFFLLSFLKIFFFLLFCYILMLRRRGVSVILRKPLAFFIKHFRLFHVILAAFSIYLFSKTSSILDFFRGYLSSSEIVTGSDLTSGIYTLSMIVVCVLMLLCILIIAFVLKIKHKTIKFYIVNYLIYMLIAAVYIYSFQTMSAMETEILPARTVKFCEDLVTTIFILQLGSIISLVFRATGFDIKKFDFKVELDELEIDEKDSEEFIVDVNIDSDNLKNKIRKLFRNIKYFYREKKLFLIIGIGVIFTGILGYVYVNDWVYNKTYKENEMLTTMQTYMSVKNSYITNNDYKGKKILDGYSFVVVNINAKAIALKDLTLDSGRFVLKVGKKYYYNLDNYSNYMKDLGTSYRNRLLNDNIESYMFVYRVPEKEVKNKMYIKFADKNHNQVTIKLNPKDLTVEKESKEYSVGKKIELKDSVLSKSSIEIRDFKFGNYFIVDYNYCLKNDDCIKSIEYIKPTLSGKIDKTLLKIEGNLYISDEEDIHNIKKVSDFIKLFGVLKYELNGNIVEYRLSNDDVKPTKVSLDNTYYLEVPVECLSSNSISLEFRIRNQKYSYIVVKNGQ